MKVWGEVLNLSDLPTLYSKTLICWFKSTWRVGAGIPGAGLKTRGLGDKLLESTSNYQVTPSAFEVP